LHARFNAAIDWANRSGGAGVMSPLTITLGDEFQGVAATLQGGLQLIRGLRAARSAGAAADDAEAATAPRVGRVIGHLERLAIAGGLVVGAWEVLVAVVALKSVARFKDLEEKLNAEYFLVGSLFSVLWAVLVTLAWRAYDARLGLDLAARLAGL